MKPKLFKENLIKLRKKNMGMGNWVIKFIIINQDLIIIIIIIIIIVIKQK